MFLPFLSDSLSALKKWSLSRNVEEEEELAAPPDWTRPWSYKWEKNIFNLEMFGLPTTIVWTAARQRADFRSILCVTVSYTFFRKHHKVRLWYRYGMLPFGRKDIFPYVLWSSYHTFTSLKNRFAPSRNIFSLPVFCIIAPVEYRSSSCHHGMPSVYHWHLHHNIFYRRHELCPISQMLFQFNVQW